MAAAMVGRGAAYRRPEYAPEIPGVRGAPPDTCPWRHHSGEHFTIRDIYAVLILLNNHDLRLYLFCKKQGSQLEVL